MESWMYAIGAIALALVFAAAAFWWLKGKEMWEVHKLRVRAKGYVKVARGAVVPHTIEEIWMTLPLMQTALHERAVFIDCLNDDKLELEKKRADNPYRADYLVSEHIRLEAEIGQAMDEFRFAIKIVQQFCDNIGIVLPVEWKEHVKVPTELIPELREELSKSS